MMVGAVISGACESGMRSRSTISASAASTGCWFSDANAVTRISAPSSSRMFASTRDRDELQDVARHRQPVLRRLLAEDRDARLELGRLDVGDQAPLEPRPQPVLQRLEALGRPVGADDDLLVRVVEGVEGVEELFLRTFFALQELDVVDEQDVDVAVAPLEGDLAVVAQRVDEVVRELFGRDVPDAHAGEEPLRVVADRVQQVRLAEPGLAPDEEGVVRAGRRFGDGDRGRVREAVGRADDERVEGVLLVQLRLRRLRLRRRGVRLAGDRLPGERRPDLVDGGERFALFVHFFVRVVAVVGLRRRRASVGPAAAAWASGRGGGEHRTASPASARAPAPG